MKTERSSGLPVAALVVAFVGVLAPMAVAEEPAEVEAAPGRYLFYLHGKIVEDQGPDAVSERYGRYEYEAIVEALGQGVLTVRSEVRPKDTNPWDYARSVAAEIRELQARNVPLDHVTVVGASKGAAIAVLVSHLLKEAEVSYVLLAICSEGTENYWSKHDICLHGNVLSIYDDSDDLAGSCRQTADRCGERLRRFHEIRLATGTEHGLLYRPMKEWVKPTLAWADANGASGTMGTD